MKRRSQKLRNERTSYCESSVDAFCVRTMTKIAAKLAERTMRGTGETHQSDDVRRHSTERRKERGNEQKKISG